MSVWTTNVTFPEWRNTSLNREAWGKIDRQLLSLTAELAPTGTLVPTEIRNPVLFAYEPKVQVDSLLNRIGPPPALQGMSGGPTLELRATRLSEEEFRFHPRLSGVAAEGKNHCRYFGYASS
jgi:hypothetical protein